MVKIGRNDKCPCGSGKKYKKCCINNDLISNIPLPVLEQNRFNKYIKKTGSINLIKIFSCLQLIPENHSKLIRLETIQHLIITNLNSNNNDINYEELKKIIDLDFSHDFREDPSEASFTENLAFLNGNNLVLPGLAHESTNVNQFLLDSIFLNDNNLSIEFKSIVKEATLFLLHIHNQIISEIGYGRYEFKDDYRNKITFPNLEFISKYSHLFEFSQTKIDSICKTLNINKNVINLFVASIDQIKACKKEYTLLIEKPFIKFKDKFYLVMPSAEMHCLNQFIINTAIVKNEINELKKNYHDLVFNKLTLLLSIHWKKINYELKPYEAIWQFDTNKFAYISYVSSDSDNEFENRTNEVISKVKEKYNHLDLDFFALHFFAPFSISSIDTISFETISESKYQLPIGVFNLSRLMSQWDYDKLTLWKYVKALERAEDKSVRISPFFSILTYFKWYKRNKESFFLTDDTSPDWISFDYSMQGEVVVNTNKKEDKHYKLYIKNEKEVGYVLVNKTSTYAPIYTSEEIFSGLLKVVLDKYKCPIWVTCKKRYDFLGKNFIDSIIYWLNELEILFQEILKNFTRYPLHIELDFEKNFVETTIEEIERLKKQPINIEYKIEPEIRKIRLTIPKTIFKVLHRKDNYGEKIIIESILKGINNLSIIYGQKCYDDSTIEELMLNHMPLSKAKIILTANSFDNIKMNGLYIPKIRFISDADISIVLEENVNWLARKKRIPKKIKSIEEKEKLCLDLINSLINQLRIRIKSFDSIELLKTLMLRHEALLHGQGQRDLTITTNIVCYSKYENVIQEYKDYNSKLVKASHSIRCLIEFINAEPYFGNKIVNDDDCDFLLAIMSEIINYGALKDSLKFKIDNPDMGLLDSGRIGLSHDFYDTVLTNFRDSVTNDEIYDYNESFDNKFKVPSVVNETNKESEINQYYDKVDLAFDNDWGINLPQILAINRFLSDYCFVNKNSLHICSENQFEELIKKHLKLDSGVIEKYIKHFALKTRGKMNVPLYKNDYPDIFPWRYNRKHSYIRRPVLKVKRNDGGYDFLWSARHIDIASDNILSLFHNGALKVDKKYKRINKLLAERNNIKGKEFRQKVYDYLITIPHLKVIPHEVRIKENGLFKADRNYGDVDIMAFDLRKKILYSIECKNTKQAKIMYDFQNDIKNYLNKQLPKHLQREKWLIENLNEVLIKFKIDISKFDVKSIVISSYQLPIKFMEKVEIPIYSFNEVKMDTIF